MYQLYLNSFDNIKRYEQYKNLNKKERTRLEQIFDKCTPLKFNCNGEIKDKFTLEEIYSLTALYEDEKSLIEDIKKHNTSYLGSEVKNNELTLVYKYKGLKEQPIIYCDLLLHQESMRLRMQKQNKIVPHSRIISQFVNYIKRMAINETTRDFLLDLNKIEYLSYYEKEYLDIDNLTGDKYNHNKVGLKMLLQEYIINKRLYDDAIDKKISTNIIETELREINEELIKYFSTDYKHVVKMIIWENRYIEILKKQLKKDSISNERKEIIKQQIIKLEMEKNFRNGLNECEIPYYFDEEESYKSNQNNITSSDFENETIQMFYNCGGIEEVMNFMDLDDIVSYEDDAKKLGLHI